MRGSIKSVSRRPGSSVSGEPHVRWVLLIMALSGAQTGPLTLNNTVGAYPEGFRTKAECDDAARDPAYSIRFHKPEHHPGEQIVLVCIEGVVVGGD